MVYQVKALGNEWFLSKDTIRRHVPGVLEYPVKRSRQLRFPPRATIDIGRIITGNVFVYHNMMSIERYLDCLKELMHSIEATDANRFSSQSPLLKVLETTWKSHRGDIAQMLPDLFCLADLIKGANLRGSPSLQGELSDFFLSHAGSICRSLPLNRSLQLVDMCPDSAFQECMERLLVKLPPEQRHELEVRRGKVRLCLTREPSEKIKRYMRRRTSTRTPTPPMMASYPHPRNGLAISQRGRRRNFDRPSNSRGPVMRSISAERLLENGVDLYYVAQNGGRVNLPGRGRRSPSQGPSRRYRS